MDVKKKEGWFKKLSEIREPGFRKADATSVFRAVNFELYAKPNKVFIAFGILTITGCAAYISYMNYKAKKAANGKEIYNAIQIDGSQATMIRNSKWDS